MEEGVNKNYYYVDNFCFCFFDISLHEHPHSSKGHPSSDGKVLALSIFWTANGISYFKNEFPQAFHLNGSASRMMKKDRRTLGKVEQFLNN